MVRQVRSPWRRPLRRGLDSYRRLNLIMAKRREGAHPCLQSVEEALERHQPELPQRVLFDLSQMIPSGRGFDSESVGYPRRKPGVKDFAIKINS